MKTLEIIIVTYNSLYWTKKTLDSLNKFYLKKSKYNVLVTVVDNAGTDATVEELEKNYKYVNLIKSDKNLGFSAGNNLALRKSSADYILLLNSDMELTEKSNIDKIADYLNTHDEAGIITAKLMLGSASGQMDKACHRGEPSLLDALLYFCGFEKIFPKIKFFNKYHLSYMDINAIHEVDAVSGACMLMKNEVLQKIGLFDERFFMYSEDMDLCRQFRQKGYKIIFYPTVEIIHHKYKSGIESANKTLKKKISKYFYNSFLLYYDKYYKDKIYYKLLRPFISFFIYIIAIK